MLPISQDEPALQVALVQALVKLIVGMPVAGGFILSHDLSAALSVFVAAFVAAAWSLVQGWLTRQQVIAPANVIPAPAPDFPVEPPSMARGAHGRFVARG